MELTIKERLLISSLYPRESSLTTQTIIKDITQKVGIGQEEQEAIELKQMPNGYTWNEDKVTVSEIVFTDAELNVLKDQVARLDAEKKITQQLVDLCLKIKNS